VSNGSVKNGAGGTKITLSLQGLLYLVLGLVTALGGGGYALQRTTVAAPAPSQDQRVEIAVLQNDVKNLKDQFSEFREFAKDQFAELNARGEENSKLLRRNLERGRRDGGGGER